MPRRDDIPSLREFFMLEASSTEYTLEPDPSSDGRTGRLLVWTVYPEPDDFDQPEQRSFEVMAHGDLDSLMDALRPSLAGALSSENEAEIESTWLQVSEDGGGAVSVSVDGRRVSVDIAPSQGGPTDRSFESE